MKYTLNDNIIDDPLIKLDRLFEASGSLPGLSFFWRYPNQDDIYRLGNLERVFCGNFYVLIFS